MPVFISYSHENSEFVDKLGIQLVKNKVNVWVDRWELRVGDSLISKVQDAISGSSALLVVLSKASTQSEWCKKELNSGLIRELDEKRVIVLPILLDDCQIPLFLREKLYADFRVNFDIGMKAVIESLAAISTEYQGRIDSPEWHTDWSIDWGTIGNHFAISVTIIEHAANQPYCVFSVVDIECDEEATKAYTKALKIKKAREYRRSIIACAKHELGEKRELTIMFNDQFAQRKTFLVDAPDGNGRLFIRTTSRRVGQNTGRSVLLHLGQQIKGLFTHMEEVAFHPKTSKDSDEI